MFEKFVHESVISLHIKLPRASLPGRRLLARFVMLMLLVCWRCCRKELKGSESERSRAPGQREQNAGAEQSTP